MAQQIAPPAKGMSALDYYNTLTSQGLRPYEAYNAVQASFGPPKTPQQQAEDAASAEQLAGIGQTVGTIGGLVGTNYVLGQLGASAGTGAVAMPTALGGAGALGGTAGAATAGTAGTAGAAGAGTAGAASAGAGAGAGTAGMSAGAIGGIAALGAVGLNQLWEGGMKDILRGRGTREDYINTGLMVGTMGAGGLPNLALRMMGKRSIGKMMTTGKSDAQLLRDDFRGLLKQTGVADDKYNVALADGSTFNIGLDGKTKYENVGKNIDGKTTRNAWDVDFSNPLAKFATDQIDPKIRNIYQDVDGKIKPEQYTGMLVNAVTSNAKSEKDVLANINAMLGKSTFAQQQTPAVSTRPPAPLPPSTPSAPIAQPSGKKSFRDILQSYMNK